LVLGQDFGLREREEERGLACFGLAKRSDCGFCDGFAGRRDESDGVDYAERKEE